MISDKKGKADDKDLKSMTYMLLTASFTYLLLTLPYIIYALFGKHTEVLYESADEKKSSKLLWYICSLCFMYLNNSVNFLLYCIGGETFRGEFLIMCGYRKRLNAREKVIEQAKKEREERKKEREKANRKKERDALSMSKINEIELYEEPITHVVEIPEQPNKKT